jgi:putative MATE family efflux protein
MLRSLLNIFLDWLLIFGKFGVPALGIKGAALATVISDFIGIPILFIIILRLNNKPFKIDLLSIFLSKWKHYKTVIKIGLPSGLEDVIWSLGNLIIVLFLNKLGKIETGIYNLIMRIELTPYFIYIGFAKAAQTLVGNRIGEKNIKGAIEDGLSCLKYTLYVGIFFLIVFLFLPERVLALFTPETDYVKIVIPFLMLAAAYLIPKAINITVGHSIRGYGDTRWMLYTQIFGTIFLVSLSYFFIFIMNTGIYGFFYALIFDETIRATINIIRFLRGENWSSAFNYKELLQKEY